MSLINLKFDNYNSATLVKFNAPQSLESKIDKIIRKTVPKGLFKESFGDIKIENRTISVKLVSFISHGYLKPMYNEMKKLFGKHNVKFTFKDVTNDILTYKITQEDFKNKNASFYFDLFLKKNLSVDDVLDKINEQGIDSLNDIEKNVLKNASYETS